MNLSGDPQTFSAFQHFSVSAFQHFPPMTSAIIVASGSSQRMGFDKLLADLSGTTVLARSIEAFRATDGIESIIVVCPEERWQQLGLDGEDLKRVDGGITRHDSVHAGLEALPEGTQWVAIHDGARPLIDPADIERCVAAAKEYGAATLAKPAIETMMRSDADGFSTKRVDRDQLWCMETPQVFQIQDLQKAAQYARSHKLNCTDEVSALQTIGGRVKFIEPTKANLKITTPSDLALAAALLKDEE